MISCSLLYNWSSRNVACNTFLNPDVQVAETALLFVFFVDPEPASAAHERDRRRPQAALPSQNRRQPTPSSSHSTRNPQLVSSTLLFVTYNQAWHHSDTLSASSLLTLFPSDTHRGSGPFSPQPKNKTPVPFDRIASPSDHHSLCPDVRTDPNNVSYNEFWLLHIFGTIHYEPILTTIGSQHAVSGSRPHETRRV